MHISTEKYDPEWESDVNGHFGFRSEWSFIRLGFNRRNFAEEPVNDRDRFRFSNNLKKIKPT
jgi:hypothetical protein